MAVEIESILREALPTVVYRKKLAFSMYMTPIVQFIDPTGFNKLKGYIRITRRDCIVSKREGGRADGRERRYEKAKKGRL